MSQAWNVNYPALSHLPAADEREAQVHKTGNGEEYAAFFADSTKEHFDAWKKALAKMGYALFAESDFSGETEDTQNLFATYTSDTHTVRVSFHSFCGRLCVVSEPRDGSVILHEPKPVAYTAAGEAYPTMLATFGIADLFQDEAGMCYIFRLADGSFIIVDTSGPWGENNEVGHRLRGILKKLAPNPDHIVISALFMTHAHSDHYGGFLRFAEIAADDPTIELRAVAHNFAADELLPQQAVNDQKRYLAAVEKFGPNVRYLKPHTGDVMHFADVKIEVLYSQVDHLAIESFFHNYNTTSLVLRFVLPDGRTVLIGADHHVSGAIKDKEGNIHSMGCEGAIYNWYGTYSKSDVVTTFHHGYGGGGDSRVYNRLEPKVVLWDINHYRINLNKLDQNGVNGQFCQNESIRTVIADDNVQTLTFPKGDIVIVDYDTYEDFLADKPMA